jgi:hypothetical protein
MLVETRCIASLRTLVRAVAHLISVASSHLKGVQGFGGQLDLAIRRFSASLCACFNEL